MARIARSLTRIGRMLLPAALLPSAVFAQGAVIRVAEVRSTLGIPTCSAARTSFDGVRETALAAQGLKPSSAQVLLQHLEDSLSALVRTRPDDVDLQFDLAVVLGARTDVEDGRDKLRTAQDLVEQLHRVLALDPSHPGAQYLLGRLNAAVMRMSSVSRFVATRFLGGSALSGVSWEEARRLLESAAEGDPCLVDAEYELARLYVDRGEPARAIEPLERMLQLRATDPHRRAVMDKGLALLESIGRR
jgi:Flp pilus assembly protein TadD